jgi:predicted DNA-binding transcriptional regulator AlpA
VAHPDGRMRGLSQCSTGLGRHARRNAAARGGKTALTVYSYNQAAAITGLARRTLERLIALGQGPAVIELSPRRRGILESDLISWLHKRRRTAPANGELGA